MAVIGDPNVAANVSRVGECAAGTGSPTSGQHVTIRGIPTSVGHYRVTHRFVMVNAQAANSRLFEVRNTHATNVLIPTRMIIKWINLNAHTAQIEDSIDVFKVTGFTAVDTTNTVTLTPSLKRTAMGATTASFRGVTVAGAAAGMTGGTLVKDTGPIFQMPRILNQTIMATTETQPRTADWFDVLDDINGTHPFVFVLNEGLIVENRVLLGAAAGSSVYIDFSYCEAASY
jgi:hypothetical protein